MSWLTFYHPMCHMSKGLAMAKLRLQRAANPVKDSWQPRRGTM